MWETRKSIRYIEIGIFQNGWCRNGFRKTGRRRIRMNHEVQLQSLWISNDEYLFTDMLSHQLFEIFSINYHFSVTLNLKKS